MGGTLLWAGRSTEHLQHAKKGRDTTEEGVKPEELLWRRVIEWLTCVLSRHGFPSRSQPPQCYPPRPPTFLLARISNHKHRQQHPASNTRSQNPHTARAGHLGLTVQLRDRHPAGGAVRHRRLCVGPTARYRPPLNPMLARGQSAVAYYPGCRRKYLRPRPRLRGLLGGGLLVRAGNMAEAEAIPSCTRHYRPMLYCTTVHTIVQYIVQYIVRCIPSGYAKEWTRVHCSAKSAVGPPSSMAGHVLSQSASLSLISDLYLCISISARLYIIDLRGTKMPAQVRTSALSHIYILMFILSHPLSHTLSHPFPPLLLHSFLPPFIKHTSIRPSPTSQPRAIPAANHTPPNSPSPELPFSPAEE